MKKLLLMACCMAISGNLLAQNTFPTTGNVGIGTTTPSESLEIIGNLYLSQTNPTFYWNGNSLKLKPKANVIPVVSIHGSASYSSRFDMYDAGDNNVNVRLHTASNSWIKGGNLGLGTNAPSGHLSIKRDNKTDLEFYSETGGGAIQSYDRTTTTYGYLRFLTSANGPSMFIDNSGKVGIGTSTPTLAHLHVAANGNLAQLRLERTGSGAGISADIGGSDGNLIFYPGGYSNKNGNVIFNTSGKVGIGTESPEDPLHIFSPSANGSRNTALLIDGYSQNTLVNGSSQVIRFKGNAERYWGAVGGYTADSKEGMGIFAGTSTSLTTTPGLYLNSDQNVGIGTTTPKQKLTIAAPSQTEFAGGNQSSVASNLELLGTDTGRTIGKGPSITFRLPSSASGVNHWSQARIMASPATNGNNDARGSLYLQVRDLYDPLNDGTSWNWRTGLMIKNDGNVGIGTTSPLDKMHVVGNARFQQNEGSDLFVIGPQLYDNGVNLSVVNDAGSSYRPLKIYGSVTEIANGKLIVKDDIESKKVKVTSSPGNWPDYVFANNYQLTPLSQLEAYIQTNKHLPEVPTAKEVATNGQDLGDIQATLLKKVEELTLYTIEQEKRIDLQASENQELKKLLLQLQKEVTQLKQDK